MGDDGIFRRPAVPQPVRIRRDVNTLPPGDTTLFWYEKAIQRMRSLPLNNSRSWRYQAAIHDYPQKGDPDRAVPPFAERGDVLPSDGDQGTFWRQCQHGAWFFLPWHRMYLHFFEKIVARHIVDLGGPQNWALPYWNYSASENASRFPERFRIPADNKTNALFTDKRLPAVNAGASFLWPNGVDLECLRHRPFGQDNSPSPANRSFGGRMAHNHGFAAAGAVENLPHNNVHVSIGGDTGLMTDPRTAALDPIFWLHHGNIDRLWEVWVQRQKRRGNLNRNPKVPPPKPSDTPEEKSLRDKAPDWLGFKFDFHDASGNPAQMSTSEVLDTRVAPLSYEYEDTSDPSPGTPL